MRRLFSEYGLFVVGLISSVIALSIFANFCFGETNSLNTMLGMWINHLI